MAYDEAKKLVFRHDSGQLINNGLTKNKPPKRTRIVRSEDKAILPFDKMLPQIAILAIARLALLASAQTPPGSSPTTDSTLAVSYGSKEVTPGIRLTQQESSTIPTFSFQPSSPEQLYTLLLVDLSIPASRYDPAELAPAQVPIAPGLGPNRTTRLHFWQASVGFSSDGSLTNTTDPVAYYNGPMPPAGDIPHYYVFYLFVQEDDFAPPPDDSPFNVKNVNANPTNRASFDVQKLVADADGVGDLVAANYIAVQNDGSASSTGTGGSATPTSGSSPPPSTSPFTGAAIALNAGALAVLLPPLAIIAGFA